MNWIELQGVFVNLEHIAQIEVLSAYDGGIVKIRFSDGEYYRLEVNNTMLTRKEIQNAIHLQEETEA